MSHTPGPWRTRWSEQGGYDCMTSAWYVGGGDGMEPTVATIDLSQYGQKHWRSFSSPRAEADARLIAAAPELLAACQAAADALNGFPLTATDTRILEHLQSAIAKAEGSQS